MASDSCFVSKEVPGVGDTVMGMIFQLEMKSDKVPEVCTVRKPYTATMPTFLVHDGVLGGKVNTLLQK